MFGGTGASALWILLAAEGVAGADPLALAKQAVAVSDYTTARTELNQARDAGGYGPDETAEIYRLSGIVAAAVGDPKAATDAFTHLLAISPKAALPAGTSPKITRPFDAAAKYFTTHQRLELKLETQAAAPQITLVLVSDPLAMVVKAHVTYAVDGGPEQTKDVAASERTEITLPDGARIDARVAALDAHGNRLVELGSQEVPIVIIGQGKAATVAKPSRMPAAPRPAPSAVAEGGARPVYLRWWPYAIGTAVFGGGAVYFGLAARSESDTIKAARSLDEARRAADRGNRDALLTNLGLGVAGAFAITAGVMYFLAPHEHVERRISAVPLHGGGAIVFGGDL